MNDNGMTLLSWIYMLATWAAISGLSVYCFYRVFKKKDTDGSD